MNPRSPLALVLPFALSVACQPATNEESAPVSTRVENSALELALAQLPEPFVLAENEGATLRLGTTHETGGTVEITVGEPEYGLNLQAKVTERRAAFESAPGGEYKGSRELGTPYGPAYYSRGLYDTEGGREEQTWIFALHPAGDSRLLTLIYTYPPGEEQTRVPELLGLVGECEAHLAEPPVGTATTP
jgi:hypothetical protein